MPFIGSSNIPNNLAVGPFNYVTGPIGNTGPRGLTGISVTGPTGSDGIQFTGTSVEGYTLTINYGSTSFYLAVTAASGSVSAPTNPNFTVSFTGSSESDSFNLFGGYTANPYKLLFKSIRVVGEATAGISLDSIYIASATAANINIGNTGSLLFIKNNLIVPTNDPVTNYQENITTPIVGSLHGITLHTFTFKQNQDLISYFKVGIESQLNWYLTSDTNNVLSYSVQYSPFTQNYDMNRTDQSLFSYAFTEDQVTFFPKISFRVEGITLQQSGSQITGPIQIDIIGKGITQSNQTYKGSLIGSCCYCSKENSNIFETTCIDYSSKEFCESINGTFNFKSCNERYLIGDCYSGGACCVNGTCLQTNRELCEKVYGTFYPNVKCNSLEFGCPDTCPLETSCCINGTCYALPDTGEASVDLCNELGGVFGEEPCEERNCCLDGFLGACCFGIECADNYTPARCTSENGVYQGPGSFCSASSCCKDSVTSTQTASAVALPQNIKIGDYFEGGIVAGFVGFPPPTNVSPDSMFAKGEIIAEIENYTSSSVKRYVPVNGVFNLTLQCNCSNFSPSRYISINDLGSNRGKAQKTFVKNLSGIDDDISLTFYNRLSDVCLKNDGKPCNEKSTENKKYGFNSIQAYKKQAKEIYGNKIPNAWILIVAPEDFSSDEVSFGMSMSVNGFTIPNSMSNYENELWQNNVLTPYATTVFDGLVNTRMFDDTSIQRNTWFIPSSFTINGQIKNLDPLAYHRFKHPKLSYWQSSIDENLISTSSGYFKIKYEEMWKAINTETTALYNISQKNKESYNGYSDWYIPSAVEMNIIYNNVEKINNSIVFNANLNSNWKTISESKYWTSTTGGRVTELITNVPSVRFYEAFDYNLEGNLIDVNPQINSWKKYKLATAHRTYTQDFSTGKMISELKSQKMAKVRACRMVPIYFKNENYSTQFEYSFNQINTCSSCR